MRIVIAGAGAVGTHLAKMLSVENENVVLLDESEEKLAKMETSFDLQTIVGDPTKISAQVDAGVGRAYHDSHAVRAVFGQKPLD